MRLWSHAACALALGALGTARASGVNIAQLLGGTGAPVIINMTIPVPPSTTTAAASSMSTTAAQATSVVNIISSGRPIQQAVVSTLQSIPSLQVVKSSVQQLTDPDTGIVTSKMQQIEQVLPANYVPLNPALAAAISSKTAPLPTASLPAVQQLAFCDFDDTYRDILAAVNAARVQASTQPATVPIVKSLVSMAMGAANSAAPSVNVQTLAPKALAAKAAVASPLCMNIKLMRAAKLQSDFQALVAMPTHAGSQDAGLGSLEDRITWSGFGGNSSSSDSDSDQDASSEELIYYWPPTGSAANGTVPTMDKDILVQRIKDAVKAWASDSQAAAVLANPIYKFFGAGITRTPNGAMYLTVVLGTSGTETCNLCPFDSPAPPAVSDWWSA